MAINWGCQNMQKNSKNAENINECQKIPKIQKNVELIAVTKKCRKIQLIRK
jgi:hypothetical protein